MRLDEITDLADLAPALADLPVFDPAAAEAARARQDTLTKPPGSLGRLEEIAVFVAGWQGRESPVIERAQALVFAGNHGVCAQGVNPFPQEVTAAMVANFEAGGAAINQLCRVAGADLGAVALDLDRPTGDVTEGTAMTPAECLEAMQRGAAAVDTTAGIVVLGEMGIGNSTIAAALACACLGGTPRDWTGPGAGADEERVWIKTQAVRAAVERHGGLAPLELLAALGGREQAAIAGAVLAARAARIPVLLDGFICTAAVLPLFVLDRGLLDHCLAAHLSAEPGHVRMLEMIGKEPILRLDMALGEGTGAALALSVVKGAVACHTGMATFAEAGIATP